ncbi:MAG TPA: hypothetical protein EYM39_08340 [Candidatus Latescibacteria bacterium]|nr:hypothetical protein [Candidatus Latescibacterota bacterium]
MPTLSAAAPPCGSRDSWHSSDPPAETPPEDGRTHPADRAQLPPTGGLNDLRYANPWILTWIIAGSAVLLNLL